MIPHPLKVALHFWPSDPAFWVALFHDSIEDETAAGCFINWMHLNELMWWLTCPVMRLTRAEGETYASYIKRVRLVGGTTRRVKEADLIENYKRGTTSLRKRYAKALLVLADRAGNT